MSDVTKSEEEILKFWEEKKIQQKSKEKNAKGKKFYMMDGPPYANGHIHMGHALNKVLKDIVIKSKNLQGRDIYARAGYDTHGVPIEFQVEKEIGTKSKKDIDTYGIDNFVGKCKEFATRYIGSMNSEFKDLGIWMDFDNPYITLSDEFIESIWSALKEADKKKLLYLGKYPVHVCTRCGTAVAFNEIEYGKQRDTSVFVKFKLKDKDNTYLIIWTTTPWTLPANTGVMVNPDVEYQEVEVMEGERWILAKDLVPKIMPMLERGFTIKDEFKGKDMEGLEYISPLAKNLNLKVKNGYKVILSARYVTTEDGTGLVHCAPGHGKEDYEVGKENGIDAPCPVGIDGFLTSEAGKYAGKKAREVDKEIIEDLKNDNALVYELGYDHDYPLCWRDKSPLLMISQPQWFLKISEIQKKLLKENEKINWVPDYMKLRMKAWLEGVGDWPISRQRYWGTPLPIWYNEETGEKIVVGDFDELRKLTGIKDFDSHKPGIDKIEIKSRKTGKILKRVPEVLDVWFDSGVASWAALGYPKDKAKIKKYWPADINIEGRDQFRGWWNSQFILSEILFDKKPMNSIVVHGMMLDMGKKKMSKSLGNVVSPQTIVEKFGRDYMRYYFAKLSKGEDFSYDEEEFKDIGKIVMILSNVNNFVNQLEKGKKKVTAEDKWIISKYNTYVKEVTELYDQYKFSEVIQKFEEFILLLSRDYIQIIRDRSDEIYELMHTIRDGVLITLAPIMPFLTEKIWQGLVEKGMVKEESIHLSSWPKSDKKKINEELEKKFIFAKKSIELGLAERDKLKIGLRWPLAKATVFGELDEELKEVVARQLNVKEIELKNSKNELKVELDTNVTPELESEGFARELARKIQAERKNAGLKKGDLIDLEIFVDGDFAKILQMQKEFLTERTNSKKVNFVVVSSTEQTGIKFQIKNREGSFSFGKRD
jgi:isoleucyl-tRNA synthetase